MKTGKKCIYFIILVMLLIVTVSATAWAENSAAQSIYNISGFGDSYYYYGRTNAAFFSDAFDMTKLSGWTLAQTAIGFGSPGSGTGFRLATTIAAGAESNQRGNPLHTWTYFKKTFELDGNFDVDAIKNVIGAHRIDDALVIFINGVEVYRFNTCKTATDTNIGTAIGWGAYVGRTVDAVEKEFALNSDYNNLSAGMGSDSPLFQAGSLSNLKSALRPGTNVITCVVGQVSSTSSDIWFDLSLQIYCGEPDDAAFAAETLTLTPGADERAIGFTWYSGSANSSSSTVQIARKSQMTNSQFPAGAAIIAEGTFGAAASGNHWHKVSVSGLEQNTEYIYRVSNDKNIYSEIYEYKTGGTGSFQFIAVGDPQITTGNQASDSLWPRPVVTTKAGWANTIDTVTDHFPAARFIASMGDQVDAISVNEPEYANLFAPAALRSLPLAPAMGNHETHNSFNWHYNLPNATPNGAGATLSGVYAYGNYWYRYNDALFVVLNTASYLTDTPVGNFIKQFDATLKAATEANPGAKWLFVQHHKSTASPGDHQADADIKLWAAELETLMDKYQVDFVLAGHDHVYSRSWSIYDHKKVDGIDYTANSVTDPPGTIYFTLNTASGAKYYNIPTSRPSGAPEWVNGKPWYTNTGIQLKVPQFTVVDVSANSVTFKTYRVDTMAVVDQYTVIKANNEPYTYDVLDHFDNYRSDLWYRSNWKNGDAFLSTFTPNRITYDDSKMRLGFGYNSSSGYTSAELGSNKLYGYGLYEVMMKPAKVPGICSSFFTYNSVEDEIDIEFLGNDTTRVEFTLHTGGNYNFAHKVHSLGFDASLDFHKYAILYLPERIVWYVDGVDVYKYEFTDTKNRLKNELTYIMMNSWIGNPQLSWIPGWMGVYDGHTNGNVEYEWVRYKKLNAAAGVTVGLLEEMASIKPYMVFKTLQEDKTKFANPEKGWYGPRYTNSSGSFTTLKNNFGTLVLLECYLYDFRNGDISNSKLTEIRNSFNLCRNNNLSVMFRAGYTFAESGQPGRKTDFEPTNINTILRHIEQLEPIFRENADILYSVQAGFFGPWGEWHESIYSTALWGDWIALTHQQTLIDALMDAVPESATIQVRTPNYIRLLANGQELNDANAFSGSQLSRLGFHHDGLFNGVSDSGTYMRTDNNGVNNSGSYASIAADRAKELAWANKHCKYTPFVAESNGLTAYSDAVNAVEELGLLHAQSLNMEYYPGVINKWKTTNYNGENTYDYITRKLGYNFVLGKIGFNADISKGRYLHVQFEVENNGFGNLIKAKDFEVILTKGNTTYIANTNEDARKWYKEEGKMTKDLYFSIPQDIEAGAWQVNFRLSSTFASLKNNPAYSVRLANTGVWKSATGYNYIGDIAINNSNPGLFTEFKQIDGPPQDITIVETPHISSQPTDISVNVGATATLSLMASVSKGTLSYQWYSNTSKNNSGGTLISGATSTSYNAPTNTAGTYYYYCVVTNTDNTATGNKTATAISNAVSVTVNELTYAEIPAITSQPTDISVNVGATATLSLMASVSKGTLSYQWYSNTSKNNSGGTLISGATSTGYNAPTNTAGTYYYYCVVTNTDNTATGNKTATATSNAVSVTVNALTHAATPVINSQPTDITVNVGATATLSLMASVSKGTLSYQWYRNTSKTTNGGTAISGATSTGYNAPTNTAGTYYYYCVVTNTDNTATGNKTATATSNAVSVMVNALTHAATPVINSQPKDITVNVGAVAALSVTASVSKGTLSYQWYRNTSKATSGGTLISGATSTGYNAPTNTAGTYYYYCVVTNTDNTATGNKTATATSNAVAVTVNELPRVVIFMANGTEFSRQTVIYGGKATEPGTSPVKAGYFFDGWRINSETGARYDFNTPVTTNITLYAAWSTGKTLISATPAAIVEKLSGNQNRLIITVTEKYSNGETNIITATYTISNNAVGTYNVGAYKVYVATKGNNQVSECRIVP